MSQRSDIWFHQKPNDFVIFHSGGNYTNINQLRNRDGVRLLQQSIRRGNLEEIKAQIQYVRYWFPNGANALLEAVYFHDGLLLQEVINLLLNNGANPKMPHLATLDDSVALSKYLRDLIKLTESRDGSTSFNFYYAWQLHPIKSMSDMLLTQDHNKLRDWCVTHFNEQIKQAADYSKTPFDEVKAQMCRREDGSSELFITPLQHRLLYSYRWLIPSNPMGFSAITPTFWLT